MAKEKKDKKKGQGQGQVAATATEFEKIIQQGRERKQNEALANEIFSRNRRKSAPVDGKSAGAGPSLASRVGVNKKRIASSAGRASLPARNAQDHNTGGTSLAARISRPGGAPAVASSKRIAQVAAALERSAPRKEPVSIKGAAGPFAVLAQNFAPGTSAADVEVAMTPVGGQMLSCVVVKTQPFVLVEMVFASREGGERVIETFDGAPADGRILKVYPKPGGYVPPAPTPAPAPPRAPRLARSQIVDGTQGFNENGTAAREVARPSSYAGNDNGNGNGRLYSDRMVPRGRGFRR